MCNLESKKYIYLDIICFDLYDKDHNYLSVSDSVAVIADNA